MLKQFPEVEYPRKQSTIWCMTIIEELEKAFLFAECGVHILTPAQRVIFRAMRDDAVAAAHDLLLAEGNLEEIGRRWPEIKPGADAGLCLQNATEASSTTERVSDNEVSVGEFIQQIESRDSKRMDAPNLLDNHFDAIQALVEAECSWFDISRFLRLRGTDLHPTAIANYYYRRRRCG